MKKEDSLTFVINTNDAISVEDFSKSLMALNDEFKRLNGGDRELKIDKVREGSYIVDFIVGVVSTSLPFLSDTNILFDFLTHINKVKQYILRDKKEDRTITEKSIENTSYLIQPIINCGPNCNVNVNYGDQTVSFTQQEGKLITDKVPELLKSKNFIEEQETNHLRNKVLFYWYQTCFDKDKVNKGNKGIIENILPNYPISVIFEDDNSLAKKEMTTSKDGVDWQQRGYIVDVEVLKVGDKIVKYKIVNNYPDESEPDLFD
ncbi:MAG: hypothetical protein EOL95_03295 [Bacteroidia bacterium]|nr:hypothetical protein [Bacteroidia bacterium]